MGHDGYMRWVKPHLAASPHPSIPPPQTNSPSQSQPSAREEIERPAKRQATRETDESTLQRPTQTTNPQPQVQINSAPNGIAIGGGVVANPTVNNIGEPPVTPLSINDAQSSIVTERMKTFQGEKIQILAKASREAIAFANDIERTLKNAGLDVPEPIRAGILIDDNAEEPPKGLSISMGVNRVDAAIALANALREVGVTNSPIRGTKLKRPQDADVLKLWVRAKTE